jgi:hypothetical protein
VRGDENWPIGVPCIGVGPGGGVDEAEAMVVGIVVDGTMVVDVGGRPELDCDEAA